MKYCSLWKREYAVLNVLDLAYRSSIFSCDDNCYRALIKSNMVCDLDFWQADNTCVSNLEILVAYDSLTRNFDQFQSFFCFLNCNWRQGHRILWNHPVCLAHC